MADVSIVAISQATARAPRSVVFVSEDVGYQFFIAGSDVDFFYCKTTDGGATWGSPVEIDGDTTITCDWFDVWFDQWTPGDTGTKIHICWVDQGDDDPQYRALDTNGDTLGTQTTIVTGTSTATGIGTQCSITKAVGGNLHFAGSIDNGTELFHHRSTDGGATWSAALAALRESGTGDWVHLLPAANTGDTQDVLAVYHDASANELTLKWYDQSADTVSESSAIVTINEDPNDQLGQFPFSASIRHSDGKLIVAAMTERDQSTGDHRVFELDRTSGAFAITELTAIATDIDDHFYPSVFIDQTTDDIYIAYNGKRDGSETLRPVGSDDGVSKVYYTKSTDDGTTWSAGDTAYMEDAAASVVQTWTPLMGDRFYVVWRAPGIGGIATLFGSEVNSVTFSAAGVTVTPTTKALTLATFAPTVLTPRLVTPGTKSLTLTTFAPSVTLGVRVTPSTAELITSFFAPSVSTTNNQTVTPTTTALVLETFAPTITASDHKIVIPSTKALSLTTFSPTVTASLHQLVTPTTAALLITGFSPTVTAGGTAEETIFIHNGMLSALHVRRIMRRNR